VTARLPPAALVLLLFPLAGLNALTAEGSLFVQAGPAFIPEELPDGSVPGWSGQAMLSTRVTGSAPSAGLAMEGLYVHDVVSRVGTLYVEEAWLAWQPFDGLSLRLGRQRLGFGCGFAWSVVDDLDPQPMPFDTHAPRVGLDAARLSVDLSSVGAPVQASVEAFAPRARGAGRIEDWGAAAQLSAFLGGIEMGAAGSIKEYRPGAPVSLGGWATVDLAGFVFGAEGAWRDEPELLVNCNKRLGDFAALAEARWVSEHQRVWLFAEVSWSGSESGLGAALSALFSLQESSGLADLALSYNASEALVLSVDVAVYEKPLELPEIGPVPWQYSLTLGAEYFF
jgi:hypothetical protein